VGHPDAARTGAQDVKGIGVWPRCPHEERQEDLGGVGEVMVSSAAAERTTAVEAPEVERDVVWGLRIAGAMPSLAEAAR